MKLRTMLTLLLLAASLTPLGIFMARDHAADRRFGEQIIETLGAEEIRDAEEAIASATRAMRGRAADARRAVDLVVTVQADALRRALDRQDAEQAERRPMSLSGIVSPADFADPDRRPADAAIAENRYFGVDPQTGERSPVAVSLSTPVFHLAEGSPADPAVAAAIASLRRVAPTLTMLHASNPLLCHTQRLIVLDPPVGMSLPGHGGYPPAHDPLEHPAVARLRGADDLLDGPVWLDGAIRSPTGQLRVCCARAVRDRAGGLRGVVVVEILLTDLLAAVAPPQSFPYRASARGFALFGVPEDPADALHDDDQTEPEDQDGPYVLAKARPDAIGPDASTTGSWRLTDEHAPDAAGAIEPDAWPAPTETPLVVDLLGRPTIAISAPLFEELAVVLAVPREAAEQKTRYLATQLEGGLRDQMNLAWALVVLSLIGSFACAYLALRRIVYPLKGLASYAESLTLGKAGDAPKVPGNRELRKLAAALKTCAERLPAETDVPPGEPRDRETAPAAQPERSA